MKTMKKFLSMAALAMVGAMMTGCSSEDNVIDQAQTATKNNVVTQTATVGFDEQAATRALAIDYTNKKLTKTFKADDQIAVIYENTSGTMVKATVTIAAGDISTDGKSATFTVSMTDPKASGTLKYIYPAAMAGATDVDYTKLNTQDGTLASLASNFDLATFEGTLTAAKELPASASLTNKLAIIAFTLKDNAATPTEITGSITSMTFTDGTNKYSVNRSAAAGPIYVAIKPTSGANMDYYATDGTYNYMKSVTSKTYAANNFYQQGLKMDPGAILSLVTNNVVARDGETITGTLGTNVQISIADGATVTLKDANINGSGTWTDSYYAGITCAGTATINLEGTNTVKGFINTYPGIFVPSGSTVTIQGSGSLTATGGTSGCGIGGCGWGANCGNIVIAGGTITAVGGTYAAGIGSGAWTSCGDITITGGTVNATGGTGGDGAGIGTGNGNGDGTTLSTCGNISITGGTVTATGNGNGAGIGSSYNGKCGTITIGNGVTSVTATKGNEWSHSIGMGTGGTCGTVTIDGVANATTSSTFTNFTSSVSGNTWTLTHN